MNISENIKIIFLYSSTFLVISLFAAYLPFWLNKAFGIEAKLIGIILGITGFLKIFTNSLMVGKIKKYEYLRKTLLLIGFILILLSLALIFFNNSFNKLTLIAVIFTILILFAPIITLIDSACESLNKNAAKTYGKIRLSGSISFLFGVYVIGLVIQKVSFSVFPYLLFSAFFLFFLSVVYLPKHDKHNINLSYSHDYVKVIKNKKFLIILIVCSLIQSSHAVYYSFSTILWHNLGIEMDDVGKLWAWAVVVEILVFFYINKANISKNIYALLLFCTACSTTRWILTFYFKDFFTLLIVQSLHSVSFALTHYIIVVYIYNVVKPKLKLVSLNMYFILSSGLFMTIMTILSGLIISTYKGQSVYLLMAFICLLSLLFLYCNKRFFINRIKR